MCGVVAVVAARGRLPPLAMIEKMRDAIAHRGPDDATAEVVDGWVALGFRRLSIIDLQGARQPLRSEKGDVVCLFNGEIYNFEELRQRLIALGHAFTTAGDGEVIVHGYEQWGDDIFARLEGMFVAVVVDRARKRFLVARDRAGIKPAFYAWDGKQLLVGSEIKALLPLLPGSPSASRTALSLGAVRMHVPWPLTAFDGVFRLPPGAILELQPEGAPKLRRFAPIANASQTTTPTSTAEALDSLRVAVARQMVADVPVGAFLSSGIDSTLIVTLMRELTNNSIHTFSIKTLDQDESDIAAVTARELGTTHHAVALEDITFADLAELPRLYDEPFAETSALGVRALSRFAREHVKVALSGDGGDEVFGGYGSYRWIRAAAAAHVPGGTHVARTAHHLLTRRRWPPLGRRALRAALLLGDAAKAQRDVSTLSWAADEDVCAISERLSAEIVAAAATGAEAADPVRRAMLADRLERLPNAMLTKVDIASMSASLEVRVPMLDDALVRYAEQLRARDLVGLRWGKVLLRRVLERFPAGRLAWKKKLGFTLPLERWFTNPAIQPRVNELLGDHQAHLRELTGHDVIALWQSFLARTSRFSQGTAAMQLLWYANVALWADQFSVRSAVDDSLSRMPVV